ncbi:NADH-quinone oxidoreductase subunit C [Marininema halotolerans]|uniref:NADH-quinone oxidoreductase subunit C n=1 Tax=Marininema halotolerans TaxID=1155944 RepID=A0A1I6P2F4_9BACL|nr:NADH-quinone oxidoreductase subunit C [Marininema halotolerans]SFS34343.1 NADH-quinone oxidoreductase subunit C [Marininema halotolerans]
MTKEEENQSNKKSKSSVDKEKNRFSSRQGEEKQASVEQAGSEEEAFKESPSKQEEKPAARVSPQVNSANPSELKRKAAAAAKEAASSKVKAGAARKRPVVKPVAEPLEPSPKQPLLDTFLHRVKEELGEEVVLEGFINRLNGHLPTMIIPASHWREVAYFLRDEKDFAFDYVQNFSGVDYETHMEVVLHLYSLANQNRLCIRVKTERESPDVPSVVEVWPATNWHERETYDLLGIQFSDHPNLCRILMPDDWVGYPLRKDYQPYDQEI